jgi:hypothetical protein
MKQLAEDAGVLLPQEEEGKGGRGCGRGRPKKDLRLVDALHQCWQGKVGRRACANGVVCGRPSPVLHAPVRAVGHAAPRTCLSRQANAHATTPTVR